MSTQEKKFDKRLKRFIESLGGIYLKLTYIKGIPDRLILLPSGITFIVELKSLNQVPTKLQQSRINKLSRLGFDARAVTNEDEYKLLVEDIITKIIVG